MEKIGFKIKYKARDPKEIKIQPINSLYGEIRDDVIYHGINAYILREHEFERYYSCYEYRMSGYWKFIGKVEIEQYDSMYKLKTIPGFKGKLLRIFRAEFNIEKLKECQEKS